jgi:hypothetical protein
VLTIAVIAGGLLLLTWGVYPLVMRGLASGRAEPVSVPPMTWPTVTAVVATREEPPLVESRVRDLLAADYPADRLTVVVAIDAAHGSDPRAYRVALPGVTVVPGDGAGGKAATLNAAARAATGDILVFTDTHQRFDAGAIRLLVEELLGGPFDVVSGQLDLPEGRRRSLLEHYWRLERRLRADEARMASAIGVSGSIYAMPRALWAPLPAGLILDDLYVPMRLALAGHRIGFSTRARACDGRRTVVDQEFRRKVRTLTGNFQLCAWLPGVLLPGRNPVWFQFVIHKLLRLLTPWLLLALGLSLLGLAISAWGWGVLLALMAGIAATVAVAEILGVRRVLLRHARWLLSMQAAILVATLNGVTGRWNVWKAPK